MLQENKENKKNLTYNNFIVGIGASAGGLEAIQELFDEIPAETEVSYVIIQHLSPDYKSLMAELLKKNTSMKIYEAEDGMFIKPNCVYVIPTKKTMTVKFGRLRLTEKSTELPNTAIDIFFNSLAVEKKEKAIGLILSGTGTDGTKGAETIKKNGGFVIVQDPATAKFDGMPNSAINAGFADYILDVASIPKHILMLVKEEPIIKTIEENLQAEADHTLNKIFELVHGLTSHDFHHYKRPTLLRRIARRMAQNNIVKLSEYHELLQYNPDEIQTLGKEFLIGVTKFFRDQEAFEEIQKKVIPEIVKGKSYNEEIKIWIAACSTGEEPYSMAILFKEYEEENNLNLNVKIFATDIDKEAIAFAGKCTYSKNIENDVSKERLTKYFKQEGDSYTVNGDIRRMVVFAVHDVTKDPPFIKVDLISCRNFLIYLNPVLQRKVLSTFHFALNLGGYLFLGPSENVSELEKSLTEVNRKWKIYKTTQAIKSAVKDMATLSYKKPHVPLAMIHQEKGFTLENKLLGHVLKEHSYAVIQVDESGELKNAIGEFKKFIDFPEKNLNLNILRMVPPAFSISLGSSIRKALQQNSPIKVSAVKVPYDGKIRYISYTVEPHSDKEKYILIYLHEGKDSHHPSTDEIPSGESASNLEVITLQHELKELKEQLQSAIEELETSNEELQSSNEELLSSNEELQSTNEELQSLNEELHTVNFEHQSKIKELLELNDDLNNYFKSTEIGQIFLDNNLIIRKYTPAATTQINLIPNDIGRPISHISNNIGYNNLVADIGEVIENSKVVEKRIEASNGKTYLMRIFPYLKYDKSIDGAVITFIDITIINRLNNILGAVLNSSYYAIMGFKSIRNSSRKIEDFELITANKEATKILPVQDEELIGKRLKEIYPESEREGFFDQFVKVADQNYSLEMEYFNQQNNAWYYITGVKMEDGLVVTFADITEKKQAQDKILKAYDELKITQINLGILNNELENRVQARTKDLAMSDERFQLLSRATNDAIWDWSLLGNEVWWNDGFFHLFGNTEKEISKGIESKYERIHPEDQQRVKSSIMGAINNGSNKWNCEYRFLKSDGNYSYILDRAEILHDEFNTPYRMIGSMMDLTNLKKAQDDLKKSNENLKKINIDLDNFIYTASHDLKAPISNIEGLIHALEEEMEEGDHAIFEIINLIKESINKFKITIKDLTEITKIQKDIYSDIEEINVKELIDHILHNMKREVDGSKAKLLVDFAELPNVRFSRKNLQSILYNLISNGIKYRSPLRAPELIIKGKKENGYSLITVTDNGLGIKENDKGKIFSMFKRLHDHVEGTGIGLFIVKRIVDNSGGKIVVDSKLGEGTTFNIYLVEQ